jgi:hypothetical protein
MIQPRHTPDLPPLPKWPDQRLVIDVAEGDCFETKYPELSNKVELRVMCTIVATFTVPEPIPARIEYALHLALECCNPASGQLCGYDRVRQVWEAARAAG